MNIAKRLRSAWGNLFAASGNVQLPPNDDYWYHARGHQTATGLRVSPETALRVAAVFGCVRVVAETVASLPPIIYRRLPDGGRERATSHPLYKLLHDSPNDWQTSFEFWEMMQAHIELRGNAYAVITPGQLGAISALIPVHPDRVAIYRLPSGQLQYQVRGYYSAKIDYYNQSQMLHFRGMSSDGIAGMSTVSVGAEAISCAAAAQEFAGRFFENDSTPSGVMIHPKELTEAAHARLQASWKAQHSGNKQHSVGILEEGMTYQNIGLTNKDSQLIEARQYSRGDIAALFRVPPHKIGDLSRATFSNIEQQNIEFATDSVRPRLCRLERRIKTDLLDPLDLQDGNEYFCEFLMDALLRGDLKSRYEAYSLGINAGFLVRNEARRAENYNPLPGLDDPLMPLNLGVVGALPPPDARSLPAPAEDSEGAKARLKQFIIAAADRVVRKEVSALRRAAARSNGDIEHFKIEAHEFYASHDEYVTSVLHISEFAARFYCHEIEENIACLIERAQVEEFLLRIEQQSVGQLVELAQRAYDERTQPEAPSINVHTAPVTVNLPAITPQPVAVNVQVEQPKTGPKVITTTRDSATGAITATVEEKNGE